MITIGIDEVGRGCWAGPLVAAAVVLDPKLSIIQGLDDSKKLSRVRRSEIAPLIHQQALAVGIGWIWPEAIDNGGITAAVKQAMTNAVTEVLNVLHDTTAINIVIDGSYDFLGSFAGLHRQEAGLPDINVQTLVGADGSVSAVSAASIVAKVARDNYMIADAHTRYPSYDFDRHVGYGTAAHIAALTTHGVTPLHRRSYKPIQKFLTMHEKLIQSAA